MEGTWAADDLRRAIVAGAKWWNYVSTGFTMFSSERNEAEGEAERRYPGGRPPNNGFHADRANGLDNSEYSPARLAEAALQPMLEYPTTPDNNWMKLTKTEAFRFEDDSSNAPAAAPETCP